MKINIPVFLPALFLLALLSTQSVVCDDEIDEDYLQLLSLLNQQTTIATRTRLNADFVPGMVSIMTGQEMYHRGFSTLWDALEYIPGVQKNIDATGKRNLIVRGIGKKTETSKIKILLNDVPVNASSGASLGMILDIPVVQIERIEFVRGPGSAIHGEFALMGVLNVIMHQQGSFAGIGVDSSSAGHMHLLHEIGEDQKHFSAGLNLAFSDQRGEDINAASDSTSSTIDGYAPGPINNKRDSLSALFNLKMSEYHLTLQFLESNRGDHFGINNQLPPPQKQTVISDQLWALNLGHSFEMTERLELHWNISRVVNSSEKNGQFLGVAPSFGGLAGDDDIVSDVLLEEKRDALVLDLKYQLDSHKLFASLSYDAIEVENASQLINLDPVTELPDNQFNSFPAPVSQGQERKIHSLVLQDEYQATERITLTAGLRYDDFDETFDHISPRLAAVYLLDSERIIKMQYAQAYRPPSLREAGGAISAELEPETVDSIEFSYIHDSEDILLRHTLYHSHIKDFIVFKDVAPFGYLNSDGVRLYGYEIELEKHLSRALKMKSTLALQHSKDLSTGDEIYGSTPAVWTISGEYRFETDVRVNFQLKTHSAEQREDGDTRDSVLESPQADLAVHKSHFFGWKGLKVSAGLRNIFGQDIRYLAPQDTYADDYIISRDPVYWIALNFRSR